MAMSSAPRPIRSGYSTDWGAERPSIQPTLSSRTSGGFARYLTTFCIGIAATLAWQSYGDAARDIVSERYPQLAWLAPRTPSAPPEAAASVPSSASVDPQQIKTISLDLAAVRQRVDQLAANQDLLTRGITAQLQQSRQDILDRISVLSPQPPPTHKPAPVAPSR
jgi:hypothetical protein